MMESSEGRARKLTKPEALARFSVVSGIQVIGVLITLGVLWIAQSVTDKEWLRDCWRIGVVAGFGSWLILLLAYAIMGVRAFSINCAELLIKAIFAINTLAFALAMARTGGASCSVFGQVIPIQLSGILLLEQQKEKMTSTHSNAALGYAGFAISVWIAAELSRNRLSALFGWVGGDGENTLEDWNRIAGTILVVVGMLFTAVAYLLPRSPLFIRFFKDDRAEPVNA